MAAIAFQIPEKVSVEKAENSRGIFVFQPLEQGYGVTIGNALRRVLLSSLEGYAITSVKIPGVQHEFSTIPGVVEDMVELVLNLKQVRFKRITDHTDHKIFISVKDKEVFRAGDIAEFTPALEVLNPDFVICRLDASANISLELTVEKGRGYVPAEENKPSDSSIGLISIDAIFTPVKHVSYQVENMRVEQRTDYEKLVINLQTDGSVHPQKALEHAANIIIKHFSLFEDNHMVLEEPVEDDPEPEIVDKELLRVRKLLKTPLSDLGLSVRAFNCLKAAEIDKLSDLVKLEIADMVKFRNFGKKSLSELETFLASKNLTFGMDIKKYNLDEA